MSRKVKLAFCVLVAIIAVQAWVITSLRAELTEAEEAIFRETRFADARAMEAMRLLREAEAKLKKARVQ